MDLVKTHPLGQNASINFSHSSPFKRGRRNASMRSHGLYFVTPMGSCSICRNKLVADDLRFCNSGRNPKRTRAQPIADQSRGEVAPTALTMRTPDVRVQKRCRKYSSAIRATTMIMR
jgi:hypothetical protein